MYRDDHQARRLSVEGKPVAFEREDKRYTLTSGGKSFADADGILVVFKQTRSHAGLKNSVAVSFGR